MPKTVDGSKIRPAPVEVGTFSHYFQSFIHRRWCRTSEPSRVFTTKYCFFAWPCNLPEGWLNHKDPEEQ